MNNYRKVKKYFENNNCPTNYCMVIGPTGPTAPMT